jgi:hypothetical protein
MICSSVTRPSFVILVAAAAVAAAAAWAPGSNAQSAHRIATPPGNVYTCRWISSHPEAAAAARVTCSATVFQRALAKAPASSSPKRSLAHALVGCEYLPSASGLIGTGVFAWGSFNSGHSAVVITHTAGNSPVNYTGYLQNTSGVNVAHGDQFNDNGLWLSGPVDTYRGGVQNHSSAAGQYQTCPEV